MLFCFVAGLMLCVLGAQATGASVTDAQYSITGGERFAAVTLDLRVFAEKDGWHSVSLIPATAPLRCCKVRGKRGYIERQADRHIAHLLGKGEYEIRLEFVLDVSRQGAERSVKLPLVRAGSGKVEFLLEKPGYAVMVAPEVPLQLEADKKCTRARIFPTD
ncbi:MAG: hypothetical protein ABII82_05235, partial [Verrucomicrobiota bacterium]